MRDRLSGLFQRSTISVLAISLLAGCATLPSAGPTAGQIVRDDELSSLRVSLVDIDAMSDVEREVALMTDSEEGGRLSLLEKSEPVGLIGPGDVLRVTVYEIGTRLFSQTAPEGGMDMNAQGNPLGDLLVQRDGTITLPYIGKLTVAGHDVQEIEQLIVSSLRPNSQFPQALVTVKDDVTNTVFVSGELTKPGRYPLSGSRERLLDVLASAGWSRNDPSDTIVRFLRDGRTIEQRLASIDASGADNLVLNPGDRIELIKSPRTYVVLGAAQEVTQVEFGAKSVSLAEAVARAGGPDDLKANPAAVFLFRFEPPETVGGVERPVVFRLNLLKPTSYLLSQRFNLRDKDVLYFATADANQPSKLAQIINQLFTPLVLARSFGR